MLENDTENECRTKNLAPRLNFNPQAKSCMCVYLYGMEMLKMS